MPAAKNKTHLNALPQLHGSNRDTSGEFQAEVIITKIYANYQLTGNIPSFIVAVFVLDAAGLVFYILLSVYFRDNMSNLNRVRRRPRPLRAE